MALSLGVWFTQENMTACFTTNPVFGSRWGPALSTIMAPLAVNSPKHQMRVYAAAKIIAAFQATVNGRLDADVSRAGVIYQMLAPKSDDETGMSEDDLRRIIKACVKNEDFMEGCGEPSSASLSQIRTTDSHYQEYDATIDGAFPRMEEAYKNGLTDEQALRRLFRFASVPAPRFYPAPNADLSLMLISIPKQGQITREKLTAVTRELAKHDIDVSATPDLVFLVHKSSGKSINQNNAEATLTEMKALIPDDVQRIKTTVQQAQYSGLATLQVILQAGRKAPDFYWGRLTRFLGDEMNAAAAAARAVGSNGYIGFSGTMPAAVVAGQYKGLGWVAKELLMKIDKSASTWSGYAGLDQKPAYHETIMDMITRYVDKKAETFDLTMDATANEVSAAQSMLNDLMTSTGIGGTGQQVTNFAEVQYNDVQGGANQN